MSHSEPEMEKQADALESDFPSDEYQKSSEQENQEKPETEQEDSAKKIEELEAKLAEFDKREKDLLLRNRAELDNVRRRAEQDVEKAHKYALEKFAKDILSTVDNLERALETQISNDDANIQALFDGVELTLKELLSTVSKFGIELVGKVGDTFDPELHQAISMQPAEGFTSNQITSILQKGYLLNGRILRPAMVMVAA